MPTIETARGSFFVHDSGAGPPVLLVHGFPLHHEMWRGQIDALAREYRVLAPDLRGFGRSSPPAADTMAMADYADDLAALLDAMRVTTPLTFCALSMGGYIAWQFAQRHEARLARLIVCDTKATADAPQAAEDRRKMADRVMQEGVAFVADIMLPKLLPEHVRQQKPELATFVRDTLMLRTSPAGVAAAQRGMALRPDVTEWLPQLRVPTLVVCGAEDAIVKTAEMRSIAEAIPGAKYVEIAGAGHMAPLEQPGVVNPALLEFLKSS